ncbi:MAG: amino acid ABC transporter permease [Ruminococcaceae bacterium]|nr:amino acid ABC transporter permease [Oscillospiraceae bacterium]
MISDVTSLEVDGKTVDIANLTTLRSGCLYIIAFQNYDSKIPETGGWLLASINNFKDEFHRNFIKGDRWQYLLRGLGTTLAITGCSMLMGILLGFLVAVVRVSYEKNGSLPILNGVCKGYLSIIRGTPVMIQLLIIYFVLLAPLQINKFIAAVICFGINSGAYVAEIVRGGIMSVDVGQIEAGRSLGLNYSTTMLFIVFPQAFKAVLPSLANEFIVLLKETSVAFYIGVSDLTQGGLRIRSVTYSNFMPLVAVALIYWILVMILTKLVAILERRLRQSER